MKRVETFSGSPRQVGPKPRSERAVKGNALIQGMASDVQIRPNSRKLIRQGYRLEG